MCKFKQKKRRGSAPVRLQQPSSLQTPQSSAAVSISNFALIRVIGQGSTGIVWQARRLIDDYECAVKILDKQQIIGTSNTLRVVAEREILTMLDHPNVVQLHFAFQDEARIYFVMDFAAGGDFYNFLRRFPEKRMSEPTAQFFAAELVLALEYLHAYDITFRDLKPENLLLSASGHLKVTDFGLSVRKPDRNGKGLRTVCGTPEYMAPEVIKENGHGTAVDCWALGLIIYEMLNGRSPWSGMAMTDMFYSILAESVPFPRGFSPKAKDLIERLLRKDPAKRYTAVRAKLHPFFEGVDWSAMQNQTVPPPTVPNPAFLPAERDRTFRSLEKLQKRFKPYTSPRQSPVNFTDGEGNSSDEEVEEEEVEEEVVAAMTSSAPATVGGAMGFTSAFTECGGGEQLRLQDADRQALSRSCPAGYRKLHVHCGASPAGRRENEAPTMVPSTRGPVSVSELTGPRHGESLARALRQEEEEEEEEKEEEEEEEKQGGDGRCDRAQSPAAEGAEGAAGAAGEGEREGRIGGQGKHRPTVASFSNPRGVALKPAPLALGADTNLRTNIPSQASSDNPRAVNFAPACVIQGTLKLDRQHAQYMIVTSDPFFDRMMGVLPPCPATDGARRDAGSDMHTPFDFVDPSHHQRLHQHLESSLKLSCKKKSRHPALRLRQHGEGSGSACHRPRPRIHQLFPGLCNLSEPVMCTLLMKDAAGDSFQAEVTLRCDGGHIYWHQKRCTWR